VLVPISISESRPNPGQRQRTGDPGSFDAALAQLSDRVGRLAPRLVALSWPGGLAAVMRWQA